MTPTPYPPNQDKICRQLYAKYRGMCGLCVIRRANHCHHIIPKSAGGEDSEANEIPLCNSCHDRVHENWEHWTAQLYAAQEKARRLFSATIVVGGTDETKVSK